MSVKLSPVFNDAQLDSSGNPYSGAKLFTYAAGSTTKQTAYQDSGALAQHTNPIVLNSRGEPPAPIWLTEGLTYKLYLTTPTDTDPPITSVRVIDNVSGVNDSSTAQDEWKASGNTPTYISATSFSVSGDQTGSYTVGRRLKSTTSGGTIYSSIVNSSFGAGITTITVANDSTALDSGLSAVSYGILSPNNPSVPLGLQYVADTVDGRLTLTSGTAVTTSDVTAATSVYFTPYRGNVVSLYDGTKWVRYKFSELTLAVPASTSQMYDVFLKNVSGTLTLAAVAWTNDTTRATALTTQDGINVKTGDTQSRYLGSFRTTGVAGQTEDSVTKRHLWNMYNRVLRPMRVVDTTDSWTYSTATYEQARAAAANQLDYVQGLSEDVVEAEVIASSSNSGGGVPVGVGVGVDSTSANSAQVMSPSVVGTSAIQTLIAKYQGFPGVGRHALVWLEKSTASGTTTFFGDGGNTFQQAGIMGRIPA